MITNEEANKRLNNLILKINETFGDVHDDDLDCLLTYISQQEKLSVEFLRLKNRETPMKVNIRYATNNPTSMLEKQYCPQCYEMLHDFKPSYCPYCGQSLDWEWK